jgi:pilus assembly protein CpaF
VIPDKAQPETLLRLSIRSPDGQVRVLPFGSRPLVVGRDPTCDIMLGSPQVSRRHAVLELAGAELWLTDSSANGTLVGAGHVHRASVAVELGAPIHIGPYLLEVHREWDGANPGGGGEGDPETAHLMSASMAQEDPTKQISIDGDRIRSAGAVVGGEIEATLDRPAARAAGDGRARSRMPVETTPAPPARSLPAGRHLHGGTANVSVALRRDIHRRLLDHLDLVKLDRNRMNDHLLRAKVRVALHAIMQEVADALPVGTDTALLIEELGNEALGLGPLEELLADRTVTEIMVVDPETIYVERVGRIQLTQKRFTDEESVRSVLERIVTPLGRRIDESSPLLDARLKDGSRVNAIIRPLALRGTSITIRKFSDKPFTVDDLIRFGTLTPRMALFLQRTVVVRKNVLVSGGTGSGKTTLLNVLSAAIPSEERIITIEDAAELRLNQPHVVSLEARPPNMEGRGQITIRDLVRNAVRMRPDRIIVGECRGGEALDMLQAMNTGHDGSMTTTHANNPMEALKRIETLALMAGLDMPSRALREQIALAIHLIVHQTRFSDGTRRVTSVSEVVGLNDEGQIEVREVFGFRRRGTDGTGKVIGEYYISGYLPSYLDQFITNGLIAEGDDYL